MGLCRLSLEIPQTLKQELESETPGKGRLVDSRSPFWEPAFVHATSSELKGNHWRHPAKLAVILLSPNWVPYLPSPPPKGNSRVGVRYRMQPLISLWPSETFYKGLATPSHGAICPREKVFGGRAEAKRHGDKRRQMDQGTKSDKRSRGNNKDGKGTNG